MKLPWIDDPKKNSEPSVSLTILMLAVLMVIVGFSLNIAGKTKDTSIALEFFGISAALYVGRKYQSKGVTVEGTSEEETK